LKTKKSLLIGSLITAVFMIASICYLVFSDQDPYKYFTGIGSKVTLSNNDQHIAFSFFQEGSEAIYTAGVDGKEVKKVTRPTGVRHRQPVFSPDASKLLYFSQDKEQIQSLYIVNIDGTNPQKLTKSGLHVAEAIFSKDGKEIYFAGIPAEDFKKWEDKTEEGYDLYSIHMDSSHFIQLTDQDRISMESLMLSKNGKKILFKDYTDLYEYNIEENEVSFSKLTKDMPSEPFHLTISPSGNTVAYTSVSKESEDTSLYEYELFLRNLENRETRQLTNLKEAIVSPVFYHQQEKILFLEHTNWPQDPGKFKLITVDLQSEDLNEISLELPSTPQGNMMIKAIDYAINSWTVGLLYTILLLLLTLYFNPKKIFLPSLISLAITVLGVAASFIVAAVIDPWMGIGIGMTSAAIGLCTLVSFLFAFFIKFTRKKVDLNV
jgi:dipeptidyl aminopeptidase/acylaminoacyl peptidase